MKIFVIGNINAGKTFYINKIKEVFKGYKVFAIDEYRKQYGDSKIKGELLARKKFISDINKTDDCIVEFSGLGELVEKINKKNYLVIHINTPKEVCIQRISEQKFNAIPYPLEWNQPISKTINDLDIQINSNIYDELWFKNSINYFVINDLSQFNAIPFSYFASLSKVIQLLSNIKCKCISFGGLANRTIKQCSDVDLFVVTKVSIQSIIKTLKENLSVDINFYHNKIYFIIDGISIEIICVKKLKEIEFLYSHSKINNTSPTVLIGKVKNKDLNKLNKLDGANELSDTIQYLQYTLFLLETIDKNNDLKFWLNTTIVAFCLYKLKYYLINNDFNNFYLPKETSQYFSKVEEDIIFFKINEDKNKYLSSIKKIVNKVMNEIK